MWPVAAVAVLILVTAAARFFMPHKTAFESSTETVRFGLALQIPSAVAIMAAELGYFKREGLEASIRTYPSGKRSLRDGLFSGEVDMVTAGDVPVVFASFERNDFRIVAAIGASDDEQRVIARRASGVRVPADLKGKKIGVQEASASHYFLDLFLMKNGLREEDVQVSFGRVEDFADVLASGGVDAFVSREPYVSQARKKLGKEAVLFQMPGLYRRLELVAVSSRFLKEKPEAVRRAVRAFFRARRYIDEHPNESIRAVADRLQGSYAETSSEWQGISWQVGLGQSLFDRMDGIARWAAGRGLVPKDRAPNYLEFVDAKILKDMDPESVTIVE